MKLVLKALILLNSAFFFVTTYITYKLDIAFYGCKKLYWDATFKSAVPDMETALRSTTTIVDTYMNAMSSSCEIHPSEVYGVMLDNLFSIRYFMLFEKEKFLSYLSSTHLLEEFGFITFALSAVLFFISSLCKLRVAYVFLALVPLVIVCLIYYPISR